MRDTSEMLRESALVHGTLPLTSRCNVACVFCSNAQNPPGVETYNISPRPLDEVLADIPLLRSHSRVVIGESATRINEGEPYTHPHINALLLAVRNHLAGKTIAVTTNGMLLDPVSVDCLARIEPVEVTVSLNAFCPGARHALMRDSSPDRALEAVRLLAKSRITFHGSMVAVPGITGWHDIDDTLQFLAASGAATIRVFLPAHTRLGRPLISPDETQRLLAEAAVIQSRTGVPVTVEPRPLAGLSVEVTGVIRQSPAQLSGLRQGDLVRAIDDWPVTTSVDAFDRMTQATSPMVKILRDGVTTCFRLQKPAGAPPGVVMHRDIDGRRLDRVLAAIRKTSGRTAILSSQLASSFWYDTVIGEGLGDTCQVFPVDNQVFGGSIACAGLLAVADFRKAMGLGPFLDWHPQQVLIPREPFDPLGLDLLGEQWESLYQAVDLSEHVSIQIL